MKQNITRPGGLHTDNSPVEQPKDTTRFVLNGVDETDNGDSNIISNEESNEECYKLTTGYIPLEEVNVGDGNKVIFSVAADESSSEIGIADSECNYSVLINNPEFNFKIGQQIDATYRLRRGCGRTIYWVDPKPRVVDIDNLQDYKDPVTQEWITDTFNLFKTSGKIPEFESFELQEQGEIPAGSINFAVQYLDSDFNPTEWLTVSNVIKIYHDSPNKPYGEIRGSTNRHSDLQNFGKTNKSVRVTLDKESIDTTYPFFRIGIIRADNGSGQITSVEYSHEISTDHPVYNYTGQGVIQGTLEEIQQFATIIDSAQHIEQLENKLILSNVKGKQIDYCKLQKYASRIKSDVVYKRITLNDMGPSSPKSPTADIEGTGYMPGEIESFGLVWVFADGSTTPVYHIPGKNANYPSEMSSENTLADVRYTDNDTCDDYWGTDSEGEPLVNTPVRHHRFPLRSEVNKPLFAKETTVIETDAVDKTVLGIRRNEFKDASKFNVVVHYQENGEEKTKTIEIDGYTFELDRTKAYEITDAPDGKILKVIEDGQEIREFNTGLRTQHGSHGYTYMLVRAQRDRSSSSINEYVTDIFGIEFSGIEKPSLEDTNGHEIVGYYIVKNERTEENKTILDSGILAPLTEEEYFVAHGHLAPDLDDTTKIKKDAFALIHPEHKFFKKEYKHTSEILHEGDFFLSPSYSQLQIQDVLAGTSYDPEVHRNKERDDDGFDLHLLLRDSNTRFQARGGKFLDEEQLNEIFYLNSLTSKIVKDTKDQRKEIFNVSGDNNVGIVVSNVEKDLPLNTLPYVVLKRNLASPYSNFRYLPYYRQTQNMISFEDEGSDKVQVFGGDTYVGPMRYFNSFYYNTRPVAREAKGSFWSYVGGTLLVLAGAAITIFSAGIASGLGVAVAAVGVGAMGTMVATLGVSMFTTGMTRDKIERVYNQAFDEGLRDCVDDNFTLDYFPDPDAEGNISRGNKYSLRDDEIEWVGECISSLWFESQVNISLRQGLTYNVPDFLNAPDSLDSGYSGRSEGNTSGEMAGRREVGNVPVRTHAFGELQEYFLQKLSVLDPDAANGRLYQGFAAAEFYEINLDLLRKNKEKIYNHLGLEYDCCSDCNEVFPHRNHWSETSFQEELTDNYRTFLPNNYRDIEGETGEITAVHKLQNNLFIHTTESLWHLPQNIQERITGDIVSFIGTGEFFSIPPKRIVDGEDSSAGTRHKHGCLKTKHGILFPSVDDRKWYLFNGNQLEPITDFGNATWFSNHMPFVAEQQYYAATGKKFPFSNNPSSPYGIGYLAAYDDRKERLIITKKDYYINPTLLQSGNFEITQTDKLIVFNNKNAIIQGMRDSGYTYEGIEGSRMKFAKTIFDRVIEQREKATLVPNTADVHFIYDTSGSFGLSKSGSALLPAGQNLGPDLSLIDDAVNQWVTEFRTQNPLWTGNIYKYYDSTERWLAYAETIARETYRGQNIAEKDVIVVSFCNESSPYGNNGGLQDTIPAPTQSYLEDFEDFKIMHAQYKSFTGIHYPIVFGSGSYSNQGKALLQQSIAAILGTSLTGNLGESNEALTVAEWNTLITSLKGNNPYPDDGLVNYGWVGKWNRNNLNGIIDATTFAADINALLAGRKSTEIVDVEILKPRTVYDYVNGTVVDDFIQYNNSWTMSFSLKRKQWRSWHSYTPNFYFNMPGRFYSWIHGNDYIWKHNKRGHYQTFYGVYYPHIVEYISVSSPIQNRIWDSFMLQTKAEKFENGQFIDDRLTTFNKLVVNNSRQISGELKLKVKDANELSMDYMEQQITNNVDEILIDNNEGDWYINGFRDMRVNYNVPMFNTDLGSRLTDSFIDKVVNTASIDFEKDWTEMESFRDKYLSIRLIFDTFDNIKLLTNYSVETEDISTR